MAKLNKYLLASVINDIKELVSVGDEICMWVNKVEHLFSWRFPTKLAKDIDPIEIIQDHKGSTAEMYILLLELAYDRILFVLRLTIEFMNKYFVTDVFAENVNNFGLSTRLTLATIITFLWQRLKTIPEFLLFVQGRNMTDNKIIGISRSTQAECSLQLCENCSIASKTILGMINSIGSIFQENKLISSAVAKRDASADVFECSQWGIMTRLVEAISFDINTVFDNMKETAAMNHVAAEAHERCVCKLNNDLSDIKVQLDHFKNENEKMDLLLTNVNIQLEEAREKNNQLERKNLHLKETLQKVAGRIPLLITANTALQSQLGELCESKKELEKSIEKLRLECRNNEVKFAKEKERLENLLTEILNENDMMKKLSEKKITKFEEEFISAKWSTEIQKFANRSVGNGIVENEEVLKPGDNPELDMSQQLISNRKKIDVLLRQNERITKTLDRIREHRQMSNNTSPTITSSTTATSLINFTQQV